MLEILFLLLPIAAGYGWYMGRRSIRQSQTNQHKKLSRDYFTGLNFLLSNESDKAVDLFISMLDVDDAFFKRLIERTASTALAPSFADCRIERARGSKREGAVAGIIEHLTDARVSESHAHSVNVL